MNTIPNAWAFDTRAAQPFTNPQTKPKLVATNDVLPALPQLARQLVKAQPWLANRPEFIPVTPLAAMEWPDDAIARFNDDVVSHRLALIGTTLAEPAEPDAPPNPVQNLLQRAHFYALLVRNQTHPLAGTALVTARTLHRRACETPLGRDSTLMNRWLDMRPHYFGKTERVYGEAMGQWAEHGVPQEAFLHQGPGR